MDTGADPEVNEYLGLLDRILEDRRVTTEEHDALEQLAHEIGISQSTAEKANRAYIRDLVRVALEDGIITEPEQEDLDEVRGLLGISAQELESIRSEEESAGVDQKPTDIASRSLNLDGCTEGGVRL